MGNCVEGLTGGGAPARPKSPMTLKYFAISGRGEAIRLALLLGKFAYHDERIKPDAWEATEKKAAPFSQLPVLVVDNKPLAQTKTILRYIGKLSPRDGGKFLYPKDPWLAAKVDEVLDFFDDVWILIAPTYAIQDQKQKELARQRLFQEGNEAAKFMDILESILSKSSTGFIVPEAGLTVADVACYANLNVLRSGFVEGLQPDLFNNYKKIMQHIEKIAKLPEVADYYMDQKQSNPENVEFYKVFQSGK
eukprot:TRINITY_DN96348_c0_g1_i1.p1 TRINITY_DN96348_c0_g1~~TRINITY_DN96348_c0_g1_i1.p1  ORF type:complete len:249 (+),score=73.45 TRINITY_DN96348_c0_g1_i1:74-820(+)